MNFDPNNKIVKLCVSGMVMEFDSLTIYKKAWEESELDFEKIISAYFLGKTLTDLNEKLYWFKVALDVAIKSDEYYLKSALKILYEKIGEVYEELGNIEFAKENFDKATEQEAMPLEKATFYHGSRAALEIGDMLLPGFGTNNEDDLVIKHVYFTAILDSAGLAASFASGDGEEHIYIVEPTGEYENDPNLTDKKFPGNMTRTYRSTSPLKIVGEVGDWRKRSKEDREIWFENFKKNKGKINN